MAKLLLKGTFQDSIGQFPQRQNKSFDEKCFSLGFDQRHMQVGKEGRHSQAFGLFFVILVCKLLVDKLDPSVTHYFGLRRRVKISRVNQKPEKLEERLRVILYDERDAYSRWA